MAKRVGIDWGSQEHAVCVLDGDGSVVDRFRVLHTAAGLQQLVERLSRWGAPEQLPIAIERPSGLLVEALVAAGHPVVPIQPNAVKASRPRYRVAGGKSDPEDAYILADLLRTDGHRFRQLQPTSDQVKALRALVRTRDDLVAERVALANQLRALLESFWPGAAAIFADVDSAISLAFLARYPTPQSAARLGVKRLATFLAQHSYSGRRTPEQLLDRLRSAAPPRAGDLEMAAKGELVCALTSILGTLVKQLHALSARIERTVAVLPDGQLVMSFPRAGRINAAKILAELGEDRSRYPSEQQLAAEAGVAPITSQSGKSRGVHARWACNRRLRVALTTFAHHSRLASPWAAAVYRRARQRGADHPHATRILARAWTRVLWRAWQDHQPYDPSKHRAAAALSAAGG